MSKFIKFSIAALILMGLMAGPASAGTVTVSGGGFNIPLPVAPAQPPMSIAPLQYVPSQYLTSGNLLNVTFTGAYFSGDPIYVCSGADNSTIAQSTPSVTSPNFNFQMFESINAGTPILFSNNACNSGVASNFPLIITPTVVPGYVTVKISATTSGGIIIDSGAANVAQIIGNLPNLISIGASNHTVDFSSAASNGTELLGPYPGPQPYAASSDFFFGGGTGGGMGKSAGAPSVNLNGIAGLNASLVVQLNDTANWKGVTKVFLSANTAGGFNGVCSDTAAGNTVGQGGALNGAGTITLNVPTTGFGAFNGSQSVDYALCVVVDGASGLSPGRTISESAQLNVANQGWIAPPATSFVPVDTWNSNSYAAIIPWLVTSNSVPTYCLVGNNSANPADMILVVLNTDGGAVTVSSGTSLGVINAKTSELLIFNGSGVTDANGNPLNSLTGIAPNSRYTAKFVVHAASSSVTVSCAQTDPLTGGKRNLNLDNMNSNSTSE